MYKATISGLARDMCMGGTPYIWGAHKNGTRNNNIYIYDVYIYMGVLRGARGRCLQKKSIKM